MPYRIRKRATSAEDRAAAVLALQTESEKPAEIAARYDVSLGTLYLWRREAEDPEFKRSQRPRPTTRKPVNDALIADIAASIRALTDAIWELRAAAFPPTEG